MIILLSLMAIFLTFYSYSLLKNTIKNFKENKRYIDSEHFVFLLVSFVFLNFYFEFTKPIINGLICIFYMFSFYCYETFLVFKKYDSFFDFKDRHNFIGNILTFLGLLVSTYCLVVLIIFYFWKV